ncbi:MAG: VWA domain-containing protein [Pseudomonadota bacterium]
MTPTIRPIVVVLIATLTFAFGCAQPPATQPETTSPPPSVARDAQQRPVETEPVADNVAVGQPSTVRPEAERKAELSRGRAQLDSIVVAGSGIAQNHYGYIPPHPLPSPVNRENYAEINANPVHRASETPVSTLSIDVDTGAYANVRRWLNDGQLPPQDAVRVEELINYFSYDYDAPRQRNVPFSVSHEIAPAPWNTNNYLLHVGIQGYVPPTRDIPNANLVFLIDVSGSMNTPNKLELLKSSLAMLTKQLGKDDRVSIVVYAGASGVVLEPTPGNQRATIIAALKRLQAGGSTNGAAGIELAYLMAEQAFIEDGINRVLIATDGDFNVGTVNIEMLKDLIEDKRKSGIALTTLGFGTGNYNDHLMEQLADVGNGNYAYIDTLNEARKVLVDELSATMLTIAKDVKIQIEFNPAVVAEYRLIGYENRLLNREDFNNDKVDAGEIGAGHTVTAVYEVSLVDGKGQLTDPLRYQTAESVADTSGEIAFLRLRYKQPNAEQSALIEAPIHRRDVIDRVSAASENFRFSAAVAAFAQTLRGGRYTGNYDYAAIETLARESRGTDPHGYRSEFVSLVALADSLSQTAPIAHVRDPD